MGIPAAPLGGKAHDVLGIQLDGQAGGEFLGHDDAAPSLLAVLFIALQRRLHVAQNIQQPALDFAKFRGAFAQIFILEFAQA